MATHSGGDGAEPSTTSSGRRGKFGLTIGANIVSQSAQRERFGEAGALAEMAVAMDGARAVQILYLCTLEAKPCDSDAFVHISVGTEDRRSRLLERTLFGDERGVKNGSLALLSSQGTGWTTLGEAYATLRPTRRMHPRGQMR